MEYKDVYPTEEELAENRTKNTCIECGHQFSNKGALRMHTVKTHRLLDKPTDISLQSRIQRIPQTAPTRFHCPKSECNKLYEHFRNLAQHYQKVHCEKLHKCVNCGNKFALERDLRYHQSKRCSKTCGKSTNERKSVNPRNRRSKKTTQSTQTERVVIRLAITQRAKTKASQTQTEEPIPNYQVNPNYSTSDFGGQYNDFNQSVTTFDQATMYDNFASTSNYISQTPEMVDVSTYATTGSQSYFIDPDNYLTQTTQTYINSECPQWSEYDYRSTQISSSTQTKPLESWYGKSPESVSRDMSSMTDQMYFH